MMSNAQYKFFEQIYFLFIIIEQIENILVYKKLN